MNRRKFLKNLLGGSAAIVAAPVLARIPTVEEHVAHDSGVTVFSGSKGEIVFGDLDNTGRMTIQSSGNVGIGTATPQHKLHVKTDGMEFKFN